MKRKTIIKNFTLALVMIVSSLGMWGSPLAAQNISVTVAGATFPYPVYVKWADAYNKLTGIKINYQSIGSGGGIKQIEARTIDFGASDKPLSEDELKQNALIQFPTLIGGVAVIVNLPGITQAQLKLTGPLLADIFLGKIKKWNDPALVKLNPGLKLPDQLIVVVHRVDGSGTTYLFTKYLSLVSPEWNKKLGSNTSVAWVTGVGGKGNEGVTASVRQYSGAIGYVEFAYVVKQSPITYAQLQNQAGKFVVPSLDTFKAAAANANWENVSNFEVNILNTPGDNSWPIVGATYILMHKVQQNPQQAKAIMQFFDWAYKNGAAATLELKYVPLPDKVIPLIHSAWTTVTDSQGKSIWQGDQKNN